MRKRLAPAKVRSAQPANVLGFWLTFVALILSLALSHPAAAQVLFGSVVGNVTDASGAGVPGAVVKITEVRTNEARTAQTNEAGAYTIATVPAAASATRPVSPARWLVARASPSSAAASAFRIRAAASKLI